jgi:hypothetical protein
LLEKAESEYGKHSPEYKELFSAVVLDCSRLLGEAERKNTWEYFEESKQVFDHQDGQYIAQGVHTLDVVERGLSPTTDEDEEQDRRVNEFVEEHTYHSVRKIRVLGRLGLHEEVRVKTISECTDWAIEAYKTDSKKSHGGYAPGIEKFMIRGMRFDDEGRRYEEQLALPGIYITHDIIMDVMKEEGAISQDTGLTKTELHSKQFIDPTGQSVIDLAEKLDQKASEVSGKNVFMGEEVSPAFVKDYSAIPADAKQRRDKRQHLSHELADQVIKLQASKTDSWAAEGIVGKIVQKMLFGIVKNNPELAAQVFDKETADGFEQVAHLESLGRYQEARLLQEDVEKNAPEASYCGAGSCGLEAAINFREIAKVHALGLKGELIHDSERACPACNKKSVYYDEKGSKACAGCGISEIKRN